MSESDEEKAARLTRQTDALKKYYESKPAPARVPEMSQKERELRQEVERLEKCLQEWYQYTEDRQMNIPECIAGAEELERDIEEAKRKLNVYQ